MPLLSSFEHSTPKTTAPRSVQRSYPSTVCSHLGLSSFSSSPVVLHDCPPPKDLASGSPPDTVCCLNWVQRPLTLTGTHWVLDRNVMSIKYKRLTVKENDANTLHSLKEDKLLMIKCSPVRTFLHIPKHPSNLSLLSEDFYLSSNRSCILMQFE